MSVTGILTLMSIYYKATYIQILSLGFVLAISACTSDDVVEDRNSADGDIPVKFGTSVISGMTRAGSPFTGVIDKDCPEKKMWSYFRVYAMDKNAEPSEGWFMENYKVDYYDDTKSWEYHRGEDSSQSLRYWPVHDGEYSSLCFYAHFIPDTRPLFDSNGDISDYDMQEYEVEDIKSTNEGDVKFSVKYHNVNYKYKLDDNKSDKGNYELEKMNYGNDFLVAAKFDQNVDNLTGSRTIFKFHHAKCMIEFCAQCNDEEVSVMIYDVGMYQIYQTGTYTWSQKNGELTGNWTFDSKEDKKWRYKIGFNSPKTLTSESTSLTRLFEIPQKIRPGIVDGKWTDEAVLHIVCEIYDKKSGVLLTAEKEHICIAVPETEWKEGYYYVYNIIFNKDGHCGYKSPYPNTVDGNNAYGKIAEPLNLNGISLGVTLKEFNQGDGNIMVK